MKHDSQLLQLRGLTVSSQSKPKKTRRASGGKKSTRNKSQQVRRQRHRAWLRPLVLLRGAAAAGVFALAGTTYWAWQDGFFDRQATAAMAWFYHSTAEIGLALDDLQVTGRERTPKEAILSLLDVERGTPLLSISPSQAREALEALPWVKSAAISRRFPDTLRIDITERQPMALWQRDGTLALLDQEGEVVEGIQTKHFIGLPLVIGEGAPEQTPHLLALLAREPALKERVTAATWVGQRRWNLQIDGAISVRLPENNAQSAWVEFAKVEREHGLLHKDVVAVDLRLPDRVVVRTSADFEPETDVQGEET